MTEKKGTYIKGFSRRDYIQKVHELIQSDGVRSISIRRIAREMGCSSASLYRHFESLTELLYYAELRTLTTYILRLNEGEKRWKSAWDTYIGVWDCYSREAFAHPEAYNLLFFEFKNEKLKDSIIEYYNMFPEDIKGTSHIFWTMLKCADFMDRDFEMCKKCVREGALSEENAVRLNRIACMLFRGYFTTILQEGIRPEEIDDRSRMYISDLELAICTLASDMTGYEACWKE
ncbi:TetR/AcrR family transcriptional regulator [Lachnospiraceae bacterium 62-26]